MPIHFLFPNIFPKRKFSETQKGSSTKCFGTVRWNHFDAQSWRPPPFLSLLFFDFKKILNTERFLYEKFRYYEIKKVDGDSWCAPTFFSLTFFDIKNFWNTERFIYEMFGYCETKTFNGKLWNPSPSYARKISIVKLLKHKKVPLRIFLVLWAKKTDEDRDARPLCLPQHFSISKTFWNTERFLYEMFRYWETNIFEAQSWSPDPFFLQHFLHLENYLKHRRVPWRTLLVLWTKIVLRRIVIHLLFLCMKNFDARFFWSEEVFPNEKFQYCETKKLTENRDAHPVSYPRKHFSISKTFWSTIGFLYEMFRYRETSAERRNFSGESWHTSPSYARKISISKNCRNTKGFPYEMRQYCEPKTLTRILMPTPFLVLNVFRNRKFSETQKGSLTISFGTVKQNSCTENLDPLPPLCMKNFWTRFFLKRWRLPYETFRNSETRNF